MRPGWNASVSALRSRMARIRHRLSPAAAILSYHRIVAEKSTDPFHIEVQAENFRQQLRVLTRAYRVVSLDRLVHESREGLLDRRHTIAVTFDDGYLDNLEIAAPLLREHSVPATFFITTGYLEEGSDHYYWMRAAELPEASRSATFERLKRLPEAARRIDERSLPRAQADHAARPMNTRELRTLLHSSALFEIGAHTRSHGCLAALDRDEVEVEVSGSKQDVEEVTGRVCRFFAYPFGQSSDLGPFAEQASAKAGLQCAVTTESALVRRGGDPYRLPRITVPDVNGEEFAAWLRRRGLAPQPRSPRRSA